MIIKNWIFLQGSQEEKIFKFYIRYLSKVLVLAFLKMRKIAYVTHNMHNVFYHAVVCIINSQLTDGIVEMFVDKHRNRIILTKSVTIRLLIAYMVTVKIH